MEKITAPAEAAIISRTLVYQVHFKHVIDYITWKLGGLAKHLAIQRYKFSNLAIKLIVVSTPSKANVIKFSMTWIVSARHGHKAKSIFITHWGASVDDSARFPNMLKPKLATGFLIFGHFHNSFLSRV